MLLPLCLEKRLLLLLHLGDVLLNGLRLLLQSLQVSLEPGDLLLFRHEAWPAVGRGTAGADTAVMTAPAVMACSSATHVFHPLSC